MMANIQQVTSSFHYNNQDVDEYMDSLEIMLDRKEKLAIALQEKMALFRNNLRKEQELAARVSSATTTSQQ